MNQISLTLLLGFLPLVFLVEIGYKNNAMVVPGEGKGKGKGKDLSKKKDAIMNTLNGLSLESFPLLANFQTIVDALPEDQLRTIITLLEKVIEDAEREDQSLLGRVTSLNELFIANQTAYNESLITVDEKEDASQNAKDASANADAEVEDARADKLELARLTALAKAAYTTAVADYETQDMPSAIKTLREVKLVIEGLLGVAPPTSSPTVSSEGWNLCATLTESYTDENYVQLLKCPQGGGYRWKIENDDGLCAETDDDIVGWEYPDDDKQESLDFFLNEWVSSGWISPSKQGGYNECGIQSSTGWKDATVLKAYEKTGVYKGLYKVFYFA